MALVVAVVVVAVVVLVVAEVDIIEYLIVNLGT